MISQLIHSQTDSSAIYKQRHDDYVKQLQIDDQTKIRDYMRLSDYRRINKSKGIKISLDTIGFSITGRDTLVVLNNSKDKNVIHVYRPFEYRDSTFISLYKKIAFNEVTRGKENKVKKLVYWKNDIKIYFSNSIPKKAKENLLNFTKTISSGIDSLTIYEVKDIKECNYLIYDESDYNYCDGLANSRSDYYVNWNGKNIIQKAYIKISKDIYFNEKIYKFKLNEYFLMSLGFFNQTNELDCDNYFSNCFSENKKFSEIDKELLKYHYSYGICKGIGEDSFDDLHQTANVAKKKNKIRTIHNVIHLVERKK